MAGSLNHIVSRDGKFRMNTIENMSDAREALKECFRVILEMSGGDMEKVSAACRRAHIVDPWDESDMYENESGVPDAMRI